MNTFHGHALPTLEVSARSGCYSVEFFEHLNVPELSKLIDNKTHCVIDSRVAKLHASMANFCAKHMPVHEFDACELNKSWDSALALIRFLENNNGGRHSHVLVIGGGITQDTASFACSLYRRGISWSFVPTTLLSMSDSCIGGKTGINILDAKNLIGSFHPPKAVFIAPSLLSTLPLDDIKSGFGEILKMHLLAGESEFQTFEYHLETRRIQIDEEIIPFIHTALKHKKLIIEADEFESHQRKFLNYGHTFGHSLEVLSNYAIPHGLAVAWGIGCINNIASEHGWIQPQWRAKVESLLRRHLPVSPSPTITARDLIATASRDKKKTSSGVDFVFMNRPGSLEIRNIPCDNALETSVQKYLEKS